MRNVSVSSDAEVGTGFPHPTQNITIVHTKRNLTMVLLSFTLSGNPYQRKKENKDNEDVKK